MSLTAQERAAKVALELAETKRITNGRVREITGITSKQGALKLLYNLSRSLPIFYDEHQRIWVWATVSCPVIDTIDL